MSGEGNTSSQSVNALLEDLKEFCRSESLSEDALLEIIERHGCAPNNNDPNITNYEFFHKACRNERLTEGILRCLLDYFPNAASTADEYGDLPLHCICGNSNVTLGMVQLLIGAFPNSVRHETNEGWMPLHDLCCNSCEVAVEILKLLLDRCPGSVQHARDGDGYLPIHLAALYQSLEFCRILVDAYPGSERMTANIGGDLPFHLACESSNFATVKYLYQLYPESINVADDNGYYPINCAIWGSNNGSRSPDTTASAHT